MDEVDRAPHPVGSKRTIGGDHLPQRDLHGAERERRPVELAVFDHALESQIAQRSSEAIHPDEEHGTHRWDVQRGAERVAHGDEAAEALVVVLGSVDPVHGRHFERLVVEERPGAQQPLLERQAVEKGFRAEPACRGERTPSTCRALERGSLEPT
jgi:hypothetical protein